jgi:hypothetical protein
MWDLSSSWKDIYQLPYLLYLPDTSKPLRQTDRIMTVPRGLQLYICYLIWKNRIFRYSIKEYLNIFRYSVEMKRLL